MTEIGFSIHEMSVCEVLTVFSIVHIYSSDLEPTLTQGVGRDCRNKSRYSIRRVLRFLQLVCTFHDRCGGKRKMKVDYLRNLIEEHVTNYPSNINTTNWWRKPLLVTAKIDDRFKALPEIAAEGHILPWELMPTAKSLIVFFCPS